MKKYGFWLSVNEPKLNEIFDRLMKAKMEIENCYTELRALDVIVLGEVDAPPSKTEEHIIQN